MSDDFVETFLSELEAIYKNNPNVQDGTVHAPAGLCADKDCETIPLLKWRLDRYVLEKRACERRAGNGGHRGPHHATFRWG
jgi:hypothetical protein